MRSSEDSKTKASDFKEYRRFDSSHLHQERKKATYKDIQKWVREKYIEHITTLDIKKCADLCRTNKKQEKRLKGILCQSQERRNRKWSVGQPVVSPSAFSLKNCHSHFLKEKI